MRDILEVTRDLHAGRADRNGAGAACGDSQTPIPASCSARSRTVSRKAKKRGPGSSRRKGPPPHRPPAATGSASSATSRRLRRAAAQAEASLQEDESGVPPASLAPATEGQGGSSELGLLLKALPGRGEGSRGPTAPRREKAAWPAGWWRWGPAVPSPRPCRPRSHGCR